MAFPAHWLQTWLDLPDMTSGLHHAILTWWSVSGTATPPILNGDFDLQNECENWHNNILLPCGALLGRDITVGRSYFSTTFGIARGDWTQHWTTYSNILPLSKVAIIRRETGAWGRSDRGRVSLCPLPAQFVDGNHLNAAGWLRLQIAAASMTNVMFVRGATFRHSLCSYSNATLTPLTFTTPRQTLGNVLRRSRYLRQGSPAGNPKPPPP